MGGRGYKSNQKMEEPWVLFCLNVGFPMSLFLVILHDPWYTLPSFPALFSFLNLIISPMICFSIDFIYLYTLWEQGYNQLYSLFFLKRKEKANCHQIWLLKTWFIRFETFSGYTYPHHLISNLMSIRKNLSGHPGFMSSGTLGLPLLLQPSLSVDTYLLMLFMSF